MSNYVAHWAICLALLLVAWGALSVHAEVPGPRTEVKPRMGRPTFHVDGEPFTAPLFATYVPTEYYYRQMAEMGCEVFNFQANCSACNFGFSTPVWQGPDEWDFSQMDERAGYILAAKADGLMLPRIYIGTPQWYWEAHPGEMIVLDHGGITYEGDHNAIFNMKRPYAAIASPKWRADMAAALRKTIKHIQESDYGTNIFGYEISALGSEEWYYLTVNQRQLGGYNPHTRRAFQEWLREKYGTKEALQASWRRAEVDFDDVEIPSKGARIGNEQETFRHPVTDMDVIDFYVFYSDLVADTIDYFAGVVKEATQRRKVVGAFYDYMYEFRGGPEFGHNAGGRIMRSDNIDFICAPPSYFERQLGSGAECYRRPFLPGTLHNKLWFHDNDLASFLYYRIMKRLNVPEETVAHYATQICPTPTAQESIWLYQRAAGFVLCEGIYESYFDLHGGYFDEPRLRHALSDVSAAIDKGKDQDRSSIAEVLILADEVSLAYGTFQSDWPQKPHKNRINRALLAHQVPFIKAGLPFDSGLLSDLDLIDFGQYKLVVFLNTWHVDDTDRQRIAENVKGDGRTLVWCYAPGLFNGNRESSEYMSELTGIRLVAAEDERFIEPKLRLTDTGRAWLAEFGETAGDEPFGLEGEICKLISVADDEAEVLAVWAGGDAAAAAYKQMGDWTSIYSMTSVFTPEIVRGLARSAGAHVFMDSNDTFYANRSYLTINAGSAGDKTVVLPGKADVYNAIRDKLLYRDVDRFEVSLMQDETQVLRYERK